MALNPWKEIKISQVLFILDASHSVEERLLRQWLVNTKADADFTGNVTYCSVPIADDPENIPIDDLESVLDANLGNELLLVPVRVVWKTVNDGRGTPKLFDLLRGNPRRPSQWKAKRILNARPEFAQCIYGKPATLSDLSSRYERRSQIALISNNIADYVAEQASLALEVAERRLRGSRYKVPRQVSKQIRSSDGYLRGLQKNYS